MPPVRPIHSPDHVARRPAAERSGSNADLALFRPFSRNAEGVTRLWLSLSRPQRLLKRGLEHFSASESTFLQGMNSCGHVRSVDFGAEPTDLAFGDPLAHRLHQVVHRGRRHAESAVADTADSSRDFRRGRRGRLSPRNGRWRRPATTPTAFGDPSTHMEAICRTLHGVSEKAAAQLG